MNHPKIRAFVPNTIYYIMNEQPNCCPSCQTRLDIIEYALIEQQLVQVNFCNSCKIEILMVEEDDEY